jgi:hypothetical protein
MTWKRRAFAVLVALPLFAGCGASRPIWHEQALPSGKTIKVTSFHLVWGIEHDERDTGKDCFALEFVYTASAAEPAAKEREALEVFELIRPASELWGFKTAIVSGFPSLERKGRYEIFTFTRAADGRWSIATQSAKVFATDL